MHCIPQTKRLRNTSKIQTCYGIFILLHQPIKSPKCPATTGWTAQEPSHLSFYQLSPVCTLRHHFEVWR